MINNGQGVNLIGSPVLIVMSLHANFFTQNKKKKQSRNITCRYFWPNVQISELNIHFFSIKFWFCFIRFYIFSLILLVGFPFERGFIHFFSGQASSTESGEVWTRLLIASLLLCTILDTTSISTSNVEKNTLQKKKKSINNRLDATCSHSLRIRDLLILSIKMYSIFLLGPNKVFNK